jgi:hypothetical protein
MSDGYSCKNRAHRLAWRILDYKCNRSAFNGYNWTASDYSALVCLSCRAVWRTKAGYVSKVRHISKGEWNKYIGIERRQA